MSLLSCPFCRTLYRHNEGTTCAVCGVKLVPFEKLPPSADALAEEPLVAVLPEDERFPWHYPGRGRGPLLVLAALGLALFFAPWVEIAMPDGVVRSGFELARGRAGWLWGGATGWFVLLPLVATRRSIHQLRGARPIAVAFSAMTLGEVLMLVSRPPQGRLVPIEIHWSWGLYASALVSLVAAVVSLFLGGKLPKIPTTISASTSSAGKTIH
jgi:hypothetical protein